MGRSFIGKAKASGQGNSGNIFRQKQGAKGRKSADAGTGAEAGECACFRPEQQKSPAQKRGLFLTEYGELGKIDTALHERQAVMATPPERGCCLCESHYILEPLR